ncbi:hypothetical protein ACJRO7_016012 [Eucalyptus globulus]|uniref:Uncharacterized protein n=1 Tax=Eucalyptus globulus TaxID=34317 RepID=A0ABD3LFU0_EUCGL
MSQRCSANMGLDGGGFRFGKNGGRTARGWVVRLFGDGRRFVDSDGPRPWRKMVAGLGQDSSTWCCFESKTEKKLKRKEKKKRDVGVGVVKRRNGERGERNNKEMGGS